MPEIQKYNLLELTSNTLSTDQRGNCMKSNQPKMIDYVYKSKYISPLSLTCLFQYFMVDSIVFLCRVASKNDFEPVESMRNASRKRNNVFHEVLLY